MQCDEPRRTTYDNFPFQKTSAGSGFVVSSAERFAKGLAAKRVTKIGQLCCHLEENYKFCNTLVFQKTKVLQKFSVK